MIISESTDVAIRTSLPQMVAEWDKACEQIREANKILDEACERLNNAFGSQYFDTRSAGNGYHHGPEAVILANKKRAWCALIEKMGIRKLLSIARAQEIDAQLDKPKELPEITYQNVLAMLEQNHNAIPQFIEEAVKEVFDYLTPGHWNRAGEYKTNEGVEIGERVILRYAVERWSLGENSTWHVNHNREKYLIALDNVFHALDGKGVAKGHRGPLIDGIQSLPTRETVGRTDYFEFKCFANHNLHLKFLRTDLAAKLNQIAGGMRLKDVCHNKAA